MVKIRQFQSENLFWLQFYDLLHSLSDWAKKMIIQQQINNKKVGNKWYEEVREPLDARTGNYNCHNPTFNSNSL